MKYNIKESEVRVYLAAESCVFKKNKERFGELSNMATGFPIRVNHIPIRTTEALYQACRFPHQPDIQRKILSEKSPMHVKMISNSYKDDSRSDWEEVRIKIMKWCLNVKLAQNAYTFGEALNSTADRDIVENSSTDNFWGAIPSKDNLQLKGKNALGRLLMDLRQKWQGRSSLDLFLIPPPQIENFLLLGEEIKMIDERMNYIWSIVKYWGLQTPVLTSEPPKSERMFNLGTGLDNGQKTIF